MEWSKAGLGKLSKLRVYCCNGGRLTAEDLKIKAKQESYSAYADRFINESIRDVHDWTIFDSEPFIMDGNSGTQAVIKYYGTDHGIVGLSTLS